MYIQLKDGAQFALPRYPTASAAVAAGHKRDVLCVTVEGTYAAVKAAFNGQNWAIYDGENVYDKSNYTLAVSICDNLDGTVTLRIGRENTVEETLADENAALSAQNVSLTAENAALNAQIDDLVVELLEGGAEDVSETEETV